METSGGMLSRIGERLISFILLGLVVLLGVAVWRMDPATRDGILSAAWRSLVWIVIAAALPWSAQLFLRRALAWATNWAGVLLLAAYAAADAAAGLLLLTGWPAGGWGWFASLAALALAAIYNYLVLEYLAEQSGV